MKMNKSFDCVEMKNEIQRKLQAEYEGLTLAERKDLMHRRILSDPILAPMYRRAMEKNEQSQMMVAEDEPEHQVDRKENN